MRRISNYAHYFMTDDQIKEVHKQEIWDAFLAVNKDITQLPEFQQDWVKKYFPEELENESNNEV